MFGTLVVPEPDEDFVFGLTENEHDEYQSLYRLHVVPLKKIAGRIGLTGAPASASPDVHGPTCRRNSVTFRIEIVTDAERFAASGSHGRSVGAVRRLLFSRATTGSPGGLRRP